LIWSKNEIIYLKDGCGKIPAVKMADELSRTLKSVTSKAFLLGLSINCGYKYHKPLYNESFFDAWTKELVWLIGLVLSDGHVSNTKVTKYFFVRMCDKDVLEKVKYITTHNGNINVYESTKYGIKTVYTLYFSGKKVWDFFTTLGMDSHKSYNAVWPEQVPASLKWHLIRGVFDGDGSIIINKGKYIAARICGTFEVINHIRELVDIRSTLHSNKTKSNYIVQYTGKRALEFLSSMYKNSTNNIRMGRKYNLYSNFLNSGESIYG